MTGRLDDAPAAKLILTGVSALSGAVVGVLLATAALALIWAPAFL
jgi:hypothetical protein